MNRSWTCPNTDVNTENILTKILWKQLMVQSTLKTVNSFESWLNYCLDLFQLTKLNK